MSSRFVRFVVLGFLGASLTACNSGPKPTMLIDKDDGWSFPVPAGLKKTAAKLPTQYLQFATPYVKNERVTLLIISALDERAAADEGQETVKNPPSGLTIQTSGPYSVGGKDGFTIVGTSSGGKITQRQVIVRGVHINVIMTLTAPTPDYDSWDQKFQESLRGFRWTD